MLPLNFRLSFAANETNPRALNIYRRQFSATIVLAPWKELVRMTF